MTQQEQTVRAVQATVPAPQAPQEAQVQKAGQWVRESAQATRRAWAEAWQRGVEEFQPVWRRRPRLSSLGRAVACWMLVAALAFTLLGWLWADPQAGFLGRLVSAWSGSAFVGAAPGLRIMAALLAVLTMCAVALVVGLFRSLVATQQRDADAQLSKAVEQLGSGSAAVRIAAVYALEELANRGGGALRQRVVDLLCGYLRTERGQWQEAAAAPAGGTRRGRTMRRYVCDDGAVESTILHVLARHLRQEREPQAEGSERHQELAETQLWCDCRLDLHGAVLVSPVPFQGASFAADTDFTGVVFTGETDFSEAQFLEKVSFERAVFRAPAVFRGTVLHKLADFTGATFTQEAVFSAATFSWFASFKDVTFLDAVAFQQTFLRNSDGFTGAVFNRAMQDEGRVRFALRESNQFQDPTGLPFGARWVRFERGGRSVAPPPPGGTPDANSTAEADG